MMNYKRITLFLVLMACFINLQAQDSLSTTDGFGRAVFRTFQVNSYAMFQSLLINEVKYEAIMANSTMSEKDKKSNRERGLLSVRAIQAQAKSNFDEVMKMARLHKIDFQFATVLEIQFFSRENNQIGGIERGDFLIRAEYGNTKFSIVVENSFKGEVWSIMSPVKIIVQE